MEPGKSWNGVPIIHFFFSATLGEMKPRIKRAKTNDPKTGFNALAAAAAAALLALGVISVSVVLPSVAPAYSSGLLTGGIVAATPNVLHGSSMNIAASNNPYVISLLLLS